MNWMHHSNVQGLPFILKKDITKKFPRCNLRLSEAPFLQAPASIHIYPISKAFSALVKGARTSSVPAIVSTAGELLPIITVNRSLPHSLRASHHKYTRSWRRSSNRDLVLPLSLAPGAGLIIFHLISPGHQIKIRGVRCWPMGQTHVTVLFYLAFVRF